MSDQTDEVRAVAEQMRTLARAASPGQWWPSREPGLGHVVDSLSGWVAVTGDQEGAKEDATHVSFWNPPVAFAAADLLETWATWEDEGLGGAPDTNWPDMWAELSERVAALVRAWNKEGRL